MAVDFLHFLNHKDKRCQEVWNPYDYPDLLKVNFQACEQKFSWSNSFTNVKAMNADRFNFYLHYIFEMWNLSINGDLQENLPPHSSVRYDICLKFS